jgi:GTP-binding protein
MSNFIDYVKIHCRSGRGGAGSHYMRREKYIALGGPAGGDGKYKKHIKAEHGDPGGKNQRHGKDGGDQILDVPLGTIVKDAETGEEIGEISEHGQELIVMRGGKGGKGNVHFKNSVNQTPRYAQPGIPEEEGWIILELKVLADVGLVGFPNAGKSTLLSVVSAAKPEIANYPFTTLTPNLGIVAYRDHKSFVMADIPGIIEGAHEGKGLGLRFLRHIERNSVLLFMVPADADDIHDEYKILVNELAQYNPELIDKPRLLAISKSDMLDDELIEEIKQDLPDIPYIFISSVAQKGLVELKDMIWKELV